MLVIWSYIIPSQGKYRAKVIAVWILYKVQNHQAVGIRKSYAKKDGNSNLLFLPAKILDILLISGE